MADPTILFINDLPVLSEQIKEISAAIPNLSCRTLRGIDAVAGYPAWEDVSLVLIHLTESGSATQVSRLLQIIDEARGPVATIVLGDPDLADDVIALPRMGGVNYLGLPLDKARLTGLIDILTIEERMSATWGTGRTDSWILDGDTPLVALLVDQVRRVARESATILLGGETGTGKTRLARQIHELSSRRDEPFLVINCGTLSNPRAEGEVFGHVEEAFDGVKIGRSGQLAEVGAGTLFLDGIEALPPALQAKLLKVIEDRAFEPLGGTRPLPFQARLIAASQRPLTEEVAEGRFRSDLYYRLNVVGFELPPLRERGDAIASLSARFLKEFSAAEGREIESISEGALRALQEHDWPGNVRELRNVMARCVAICPDKSIRREDLPMSVLEGLSRINPIPNQTFATLSTAFQWSSQAGAQGRVELARITKALEKHSNNRLRAASELGISRMTLYKKLHKYGLIHPSPTPHGMV